MTPAETMPLALQLSAYGLATVFASLVAFATLVKVLVRVLSAEASSSQGGHGGRQ